MKAIVFDEFGDESVMQVGEVEPPPMEPGALRIRVAAAGVNRADLLQRQGLYPPPPGASKLLGLECSGEVSEVGAGVSGWQVGDAAMALLTGGGYAEQVVVPAGQVMRIPERLPVVDAAGLPEVYLTVFLNVFELGGLCEGGAVLVHGGGSGIGTATIQLAKLAGAQCIVTAGSDEKCRRCLDLGADVAVNYRTQDFVHEVAEATEGHGVDVVLDSIGGPYLDRNLRSLAVGGRLVVIGLMGGAKSEIALGAVLTRRLQVIGSTLRARPVAEKAALVASFEARFGSAIEEGRLAPVIHQVFDFADAGEAHRQMKASEHFGKLLLRVS